MQDLDRYIQQVYAAAVRQIDWRANRIEALATLARACEAQRALWITGMPGRPDATETCWPPDAGLTAARLAALTPGQAPRCQHLKPLPAGLAASGGVRGEGVLLQYAHRGSELHSRLLLCFARAAPAEIDTLQRAGGHLIEAGSLTLSLLLERDEWLTALGRTARGPAALVDGEGRYYARSAGFTRLIEACFGEAGTALPVPLPPLKARGDTLRAGPLMLRLSPLDGLWLVHARLPRALDGLSPREQQVARALAEGKTFKRIAQQMQLSASTVANHAASIYRKLGIFRREELLALMREGGATPDATSPMP